MPRRRSELSASLMIQRRDTPPWLAPSPYIPELLPDVLEGRINPGRVLDYETGLEGIADAYAAMHERRAIKALVRVGAL